MVINQRVLSRRVLNRTTLQRQWLLRRADRGAMDAVAHLLALQAQKAEAPYIGLWTRLTDFRQPELTSLLYERRVVRSSVLRGTQHVLAAADFRWLRPTIQPVLDRGRQSNFGRATAGLDLTEFATVARQLLAGAALTRPEVGRLLAERYPAYDAASLGWSAQCLLPLVHPPPSGTWRRGGATPFRLAEEWLDAPLLPPRPEEMISRYLAAFGPAGVSDLQVWSGVRGLREIADRLPLRRYRDEAGQELLDLPELSLAPEELPAPVRFLPEFDNVLLAHADRSRIMSDDDRRRVIVGSMVRATFLVDGFVHGTWSITDGELALHPYRPLSDTDETALRAEGDRLVAFASHPVEPRR